MEQVLPVAPPDHDDVFDEEALCLPNARLGDANTLRTDPPPRPPYNMSPVPGTSIDLSTSHTLMSRVPTPTAPAATIDDLLDLHDEAFVRCAYQTIMRRPADTDGLTNYLRQLRRGVSKRHIVAAFAMSDEGRGAAVDIPGLRELIKQQQPRRVSLMARIVKRIASEALRPLETQLRSIENGMHAISQDSVARFERLEESNAELRSMIADVDGIPHGSSSHSDLVNRPEFDAMTPRARLLYRRMRSTEARGRWAA